MASLGKVRARPARPARSQTAHPPLGPPQLIDRALSRDLGVTAFPPRRACSTVMNAFANGWRVWLVA